MSFKTVYHHQNHLPVQVVKVSAGAERRLVGHLHIAARHPADRRRIVGRLRLGHRFVVGSHRRLDLRPCRRHFGRLAFAFGQR